MQFMSLGEGSLYKCLLVLDMLRCNNVVVVLVDQVLLPTLSFTLYKFEWAVELKCTPNVSCMIMLYNSLTLWCAGQSAEFDSGCFHRFVCNCEYDING